MKLNFKNVDQVAAFVGEFERFNESTIAIITKSTKVKFNFSGDKSLSKHIDAITDVYQNGGWIFAGFKVNTMDVSGDFPEIVTSLNVRAFACSGTPHDECVEISHENLNKVGVRVNSLANGLLDDFGFCAN
ncbi:hypothetical protein E0765_07440 [Sulfuricurvum sp. IAE1]|uniref:hypothetical protein n=1 Tax=Sulfuricurvum sp. IAE1 TaxID=2546102 RepID=UPI00104F4989|nr:hypothetical protein [Sulfuricurvum sp. IAE1]TDA63660.1 hypothetical protein E0765_07440 [Sulfuricurvum sp. IAE1]